MDGSKELETLLAAARDLYLVHLLQITRQWESDDTDFEIEPVCLDRAGDIIRGGTLGLPRRDALVRTSTSNIREPELVQTPILPVERVALRPKPALLLNMRPFRWNHLWLRVDPRCNSALLNRIRLWYLDWFQARVAIESPGLKGAVHRLDGPHETEGVHWFCVDLGTAPVDAPITLLGLLAEGGARRVHIGDHPSAAMTWGPKVSR